MLADRPRLRRAVWIAGILACVAVAHRVRASESPCGATSKPVPPTPPIAAVSPADTTSEIDAPVLILATLYTEPTRTTTLIESDWAKAYRGEGDGSIATWTTMRNVNVPSLDGRMFAEVRPFLLTGQGIDLSRSVLIEVRAVVPGDAEAALARVRANPEIERAELWTVQGHRGGVAPVE